MARTEQIIQPIELDCADAGVTQQMTRWLSHLRAERRLSPKTLEAYARDLRQCLDFLREHWGTRVTLARFSLLEATDIQDSYSRRLMLCELAKCYALGGRGAEAARALDEASRLTAKAQRVQAALACGGEKGD